MVAKSREFDLLICGGEQDPNILCLQKTAQNMGIDFLTLSHSRLNEPNLLWDFQSGSFSIDGERLTTKGAFVRYDVFGASGPSKEGLDRSYGWFSACLGATAAMTGIRSHNLRMDLRASHKPFVLTMAQKHGLTIPRTLITNNLDAITDFGETSALILKPVAGGAYTKSAEDVMDIVNWHQGQAPMPAIVQEKLVYPEYRIFRYGQSLMTFEITSTHLDYRPHGDNTLRRVENSVLGKPILSGLIAMSDEMSVNFFACDFKTSPDTGQPVFLELNSGPMFAAFDYKADGELSKGLINWLIGNID